mgnify:CR=1 FL=1
MLRVKTELQQVVVTTEYAVHKFSCKGRSVTGEAEDEWDADIGRKVKAIVLDDEGFWKPLTLILHVAMPIVKLLRLMDGNKFCMGKVYDGMFMIGQRIESMQSKVPWFKDLAKVHAGRWEYLHSPMHAAGYALDPQYMQTVGDLDDATMDGLQKIFDRLCLRDAILASPNPEEAWKEYTLSNPAVVNRVAQVEG